MVNENRYMASTFASVFVHLVCSEFSMCNKLIFSPHPHCDYYLPQLAHTHMHYNQSVCVCQFFCQFSLFSSEFESSNAMSAFTCIHTEHSFFKPETNVRCQGIKRKELKVPELFKFAGVCVYLYLDVVSLVGSIEFPSSCVARSLFRVPLCFASFYCQLHEILYLLVSHIIFEQAANG